jgi:hypothetical protein
MRTTHIAANAREPRNICAPFRYAQISFSRIRFAGVKGRRALLLIGAMGLQGANEKKSTLLLPRLNIPPKAIINAPRVRPSLVQK